MGKVTDWLLQREFFRKAVSMQAYQMTEQLKFPPRNTHRPYDEEEFSPERKFDYIQTYEKHIWIYSTVYAIASTVAQLPIRVYALDSKGKRGEEIQDGPLWRLVNRPNPNETRFDFIEALLSYMELTGDGFIEKNHPVTPTQLYVLRSDFMKINSSADKLVVTYDYQPHGVRSTQFKPEEIIHLKYFHPRSEVYGFSFVQAARNSLVLDFDAIKFQKNFFKQGCAIDKYVSVKNQLSPTEYNRFKEEIRAEYSGVDKSHLPMVLDNDGEMKSVGVTMDKVLLGEQRALNRDEIFSGSGVPPIMANLLAGKETYNNASTQEKAFWQNTIKPKTTKIQDKLNIEVFNKMGAECEFDFSGVIPLQEDKKVKADTSAVLVNAGLFSPNEIREDQYQAEPVPGGEALRNPQPVAPFGAFAGSQPPPVAAQGLPQGGQPAEGPPLSSTTLNGAQITDAIGVVQALARNEIGPIAAAALLAAVGISEEVATKITGERVVPVKEEPPKPVVKAAKLKPVVLEESLAYKPILSVAEKIMTKMADRVISRMGKGQIKKAAFTGVEEIIAGLDAETLGMVEDLSKVESKAFMEIVAAQFNDVTGKPIPKETAVSIEKRITKQVNAWAKKSSDSIVETMASRVKSYLTDIPENADIGDVTTGVREIFEGTDREEFPWARAIARTETLKIQGGGTMVAMKAGGFTHKTWIAGGPPGDRKEHTALDGQTIPIDEPFVIQNEDGTTDELMYPGDPNANVKQLVNCRCTLTEGEEE